MFAGTSFIKDHVQQVRAEGGPHSHDVNAWAARNLSLRGSQTPWASKHPNHPLADPHAGSLEAKVNNVSKTSTAETDVPSWEQRVGAGARGSGHPNYTSSLTRASLNDPKLTRPMSSSAAPGQYGKWSTQENDMASWEHRLRGGGTATRGSTAPWSRLMTAPPGQPPAPLAAGAGDGAGAGAGASSSTAETSTRSWQLRAQAGGRGAAAPNAHNSSIIGHWGEAARTDPSTIPRLPPAGTEGGLNQSSTEAVDMASWTTRMRGAAGNATRGQQVPWRYNLKAGTAPLEAIQPLLKEPRAWLGNTSSTAATATREWEDRMNRVYANNVTASTLRSSKAKDVLDTYKEHGGFA